MAAKRNGLTTVIIPKNNVRDLDEIDQTVREALRFVAAETVEQVFAEALYPAAISVREEVAPLAAPVNRERSGETVLRQ